MFAEAIDFLADLMRRGGPVMWPLALCSIIALLITLRKLLQWSHWKIRCVLGADEWKTLLDGMLDATPTAAHADAPQTAQPLKLAQLVSSHRSFISPYTQIVKIATEQNLPLEVVAQKEVRTLRRGLSVLDTIVTLAPMLGILGTVTGIITSFDLMGAAGVEDPTGVTAGIAEALITTASGLVVSIVALLPLNYGRVWCKEAIRALEEALTRFESHLPKA